MNRPRTRNPKSGFQPGHPFYRSRKPGAYVPTRSPKKENYEPIAFEEIPAGTKWKPSPPHTGPTRAYTSLFGNQYRLVRELATGAVTYFKHKGAESPAAPKEQIDAEPAPRKQVRYRVGARCWWVEHGRWYLVTVIARPPQRVRIRPVTGQDAEKQADWPHPGEFEFSANGTYFKHLRPLKDRNP